MNQMSFYTPENLTNISCLRASERAFLTLLQALLQGETNWSDVLVQLELEDELTMVHPCILSTVLSDVTQEVSLIEREVQLRILAVMLQKMGKHWNAYRDIIAPNAKEWEKQLIENTTGEIDPKEIQKQVWFCLLKYFEIAQESLKKITTYNLIQEGIKQEICMIVAMLVPQVRKLFPQDVQWSSDRLYFRKIQEEDKVLLQEYFTPAVGKYLSIDALNHPVLVQAYIQQSQIEMLAGTCLVLMAFERDTIDFVGALTLNDMNQETVEIGLWVREEQQGKGFGEELLNQAIAIICTEISTKQIIYTVEKENHKSIALCQKKGFQFESELILEPTPLKNKYREMLRFVKQVVVE
ncbi:GNAT family N-acetyltransferase [Myroides sp. 1354]|nr:GNAT family N-acetyltransferase [Myroides sp. R163-1]MDM1057470.1 GNAT family N-acetyltransferase [Myroides sp. 1354]MDM1070755.1 GNAT family N-acetyltransferase [Myroides sp. 1372]